mmetsp:Transcript_16555/g.24423  ORF Transcript_16555/g.24423 Transcript_16555/m.24423 type:complete len:123 (+) Transcript_16555:181-549(+)|eukprot:CAMPEP_0194215142 /NCGR_PEP_ID=MMETSP0156-20130528/16707_1 /TAXON_ID=33649 /ORGANISM="Thalassionema nitzschioides, Strain L26-B" /LENGTH=122 /DNA_ID=CAMNT_0038943577 /DNA_START=103 /DNA_END=471 /DNA_ORIENTATION=+
MTQRGPLAAKGLYRLILRAHERHLPPKMRNLGDTYVKAEFRLHRNASQSEHIQSFMNEWNHYLQQILATSRAKDSVASGTLDADKQKDPAFFSYGKDLPHGIDLSDEQKEQLQKLKEETKKS